MKLSNWDKFLISIAPRWGTDRVRARLTADALTRNYEAAKLGRRTQGWARNTGDANSVMAVAISELRMHARDLVRNNSWARRGQRIISNHSVGWGIVPRPPSEVAEVWKEWADSTACDADGRLNFYGIQAQVMRSIAQDGEILIRRRWRRPEDKLPLPLQLQVLEADFLDTSQDGITLASGNVVKLGVEFDKIGRRVAYWLFDEHPGNRYRTSVSRRIDASEIIHGFYAERPGQIRGVSWFGSAIVNLKDLDEYEDAELLKQKIAACFAAFVTDLDGQGTALGGNSVDDDIDVLEPGMVANLPVGKDVKFGNPPNVTDSGFATRQLRRIAAGLGVTYEDLTGDYSQVNFSSARMGRLAHWANVRDWQWNMMIPQFCNAIWAWAMEAAQVGGLVGANLPRVEWTTPPMPMIEPDKEGLAYQRLVRNGTMTHDEMVREQGGDPEAHWIAYAAGLKRLDALGIQLDSDVRAVSQAGLTQQRVGAGGGQSAASEADRTLEQALLRELGV